MAFYVEMLIHLIVYESEHCIFIITHAHSLHIFLWTVTLSQNIMAACVLEIRILEGTELRSSLRLWSKSWLDPSAKMVRSAIGESAEKNPTKMMRGLETLKELNLLIKK